MQQLGAVILLIGGASWMLIALVLVVFTRWLEHQNRETWDRLYFFSLIWFGFCVLASLTPLIYEKLQ